MYKFYFQSSIYSQLYSLRMYRYSLSLSTHLDVDYIFGKFNYTIRNIGYTSTHLSDVKDYIRDLDFYVYRNN